MVNRVVEEKEFRLEFRKNAESVCDFSQRKSKHILGIGARQMIIDVGVEVANAIKGKYTSDGRSLDRSMAHLHTPKGLRTWVSQQLSAMSNIRPVDGANAIETLWRTFGVLIPVARRGVRNVYVAKNGATALEWASVGALKEGKTAAAIKRDEALQDILAKGRDALRGRETGEAYAETCTEYFKSLQITE